MKYLRTISFTALLIFSIGLHAYCQTNGNGKEKPGTTGMVKLVMPPDSVAIISLNDIDNYLIALKKISVEKYEKMTPQQVVEDIYRWMILEWNRKKKK